MTTHDKTPEEVLIDIAREHPDFYEKYVIKGDEPIDTMYGDEFATLLIEKQIPFSVSYPLEFQASFHVDDCYKHRVLALLMQLRGSKLR